MQQEEAAQEGAAGEPGGGQAPQEEHRRTPYGWRRAYSLPPSLGHHRQPGIDNLNSLAGLAAWRRQQKQLEAAKVPASKRGYQMQPESAE